MTLPILAKKVKKLASFQFFNLKLLLNDGPKSPKSPPVFASLDDVLTSRGFSKFKKTYKLKGELGRGGFGIVYRAVRIADETPVAVKFIDRRNVRDWGKLNDERVPMEICMLARCTKVRGVIRLLDWYSIPEGFLIVMERPYPCIDMFDFIKGQTKLDEDMARFLFTQVVQTIAECSEKRVLHRDLKDENIVIDLVTGETKLIDFGAATILKKSHYTDFQGTRLYCPPEWFLHNLYLGREAAVWSLGVLLYNMLNGRLPFRNEKDICTAHLLGPLPFYTQVSDEAKDLITKCLTFDPFTRCTFDDVIRHSWTMKAVPDWATLSAGHAKEDEAIQEEEEDLDEEADEDVEDDLNASGEESESGVGSSASTSRGSEEPGPAAVARQVNEVVARFAKTSLIAPPNSQELKAVVQATEKTKTTFQKVPIEQRKPRVRKNTLDPNHMGAMLATLRKVHEQRV